MPKTWISLIFSAVLFLYVTPALALHPSENFFEGLEGWELVQAMEHLGDYSFAWHYDRLTGEQKQSLPDEVREEWESWMQERRD